MTAVCRWQLIELSTSSHEMFVRRLTTKSPSAAAASAGMERALHEVGTKSRPKCGGGQVAGAGGVRAHQHQTDDRHMRDAKGPKRSWLGWAFGLGSESKPESSFRNRKRDRTYALIEWQSNVLFMMAVLG
uniref:HDC05445 n=1 Tax=Drosophila melanogaster TaxID=7227 RepID=Q6IGS8_DROME|nr:TPA_inf: HDC05445 [Drosophila melanogaster]